MRVSSGLAAAIIFAGCAPAHRAAAPSPGDGSPVETRADLVRAFHERGWTAHPLAFVQPLGIVGGGTIYRVQGETVVVYDYASPEEAAAHAHDDAALLRQRGAGRGVTVYRRPSLVVVTRGRTRTAFHIELERILSGPSVAQHPRRP